MVSARIQPATVSTGQLGFTLGPRLNAAGRLDTAMTSYALIQCASTDEARPLAQKLHEQNLERQQLLEAALSAAQESAASQAGGGRLIFVASKDFRPGIVGLVAGKLAEQFYRPAIAIEQQDEISRGSCRSVPEFDIAGALDECADLLDRHGGHNMAAGFTVRTERLEQLRERLAAIAQRELAGAAQEASLAIDCDVPLAAATWALRKDVKKLEPFGVGNPVPLAALLRCARQQRARRG